MYTLITPPVKVALFSLKKINMTSLYKTESKQFFLN
jgi:hypothetical protein